MSRDRRVILLGKEFPEDVVGEYYLREGTRIVEEAERIRQREIQEGLLYDCPEGNYAKRINVDGSVKCEGFSMGVGGIAVAAHCKSCEHYIPRNLRQVQH